METGSQYAEHQPECRLQATLNEFKAFYNQIRPHQNLGGLTPDEAWHGQTLAEVQRTNAQTQGQWVQALGGLLVGYRRKHKWAERVV